jgi:hypothetical protein
MKLTNEQIQKNNELFANSLTYKIIWKQNFYKIILSSWNYDNWYVDNYIKVIEKFLNDYENECNNLLKKINNL